MATKTDSFGELAAFLNSLTPPDDNDQIEVTRETLEQYDEKVIELSVAMTELIDMMPDDGTALVYSARTGEASIGPLDVTEELDRVRAAYLDLTAGQL
ncbi:MAG: hypothetical protein LDL56_00575 [Armatimonadetes bacterium]|nr:hypothetical protein [Armatimonadota bacterium]MCA1995704.1 hypothetical protein [Armatimonadota bacterium]